MTTETDELLKRISDDGEGFVNKEGVPPDAFGDPGGEYPKANYQNQQTLHQLKKSFSFLHLQIYLNQLLIE